MTVSTALSVPSAATARSSVPMRAVLQRGYGGTDVLRVGDTVRPRPERGEVLVRVHAAGIDRGTWHLMTGRPYLMRIMGFGFSAPKNPVPGLDLAGTVVALGEGVTRFKVGDRVFGIGRGSFAEFACAREDKLARVPAGASFEEAALLGVSALTALGAIEAAGLCAGERALIVGASGGVGSYAVQIAKALGAEVSAVCSAGKADHVRRLGAAIVFDYRTQDFADGANKYDVILDLGGNTPLSRLRAAMTERGRLVFVGGENGGDWTAGFGRPLGALLLGLFVKQRFMMFAAKEHHEPLERIAAMFEAGAVRPTIDRTVGLDGVSTGLAELEAGRITGKISVRIAGA